MKCRPDIKGTKRDWIRGKRQHIKAVLKHLDKLENGCAISAIYGTGDFGKAVTAAQLALDRMDEITKKLR